MGNPDQTLQARFGANVSAKRRGLLFGKLSFGRFTEFPVSYSLLSVGVHPYPRICVVRCVAGSVSLHRSNRETCTIVERADIHVFYPAI